MQTGVVDKYIEDKGFGFIKQENEEDNLFFHISEVKDQVTPEVGAKVEFDIGENERGKNIGKPCAVNVRVL